MCIARGHLLVPDDKKNTVKGCVIKPVNFSLGLLNCHFLFSCDTAPGLSAVLADRQS